MVDGEGPIERMGTAWLSLARPLIPVLIGVGLLSVSVVQTGHATRARIHDLDRYVFEFRNVECAPPPGMDRADFISEVQYIAGVPGQLMLLDEDLASQVAEAFAQHPWVEAVERVELCPPSRVAVSLKFRHPVLQVVQDGLARAVDRHGTLLPVTAPVTGLPTYDGVPTKPAGPVGTQWNDRAIVAAAKAAASRLN